MALPKKLASTKRFGTRYGKRLKTKTALIEAEYKRKHECPSCHALKAKRMSAGIWKCLKCNSVFTGRAYTTVKKQKLIEIPNEKEFVLKKRLAKEDYAEEESEDLKE